MMDASKKCSCAKKLYPVIGYLYLMAARLIFCQMVDNKFFIFKSGRNIIHKVVLKSPVKRHVARICPIRQMPVESRYGFTLYSIL